jgi:quercetin dioxygenase-like cupin family protein
MPSIQRPLSGDVLVFDLDAERELAADPSLLGRSGKSARTLLKSGPLRVTMIVLAPGGELAEHSAEGPITVQPLRGAIRFTAQGTGHDLKPGQVIALGPGVRHQVSSDAGSTFLVTMAHDVELPPAEISG